MLGIHADRTACWQSFFGFQTRMKTDIRYKYRSADKTLARPGRKQATAAEDFDVHNPINYQNWRNISTIYVYNKTSIERNILTIKVHREVGRAKDLSAPWYILYIQVMKSRRIDDLDMGHACGERDHLEMSTCRREVYNIADLKYVVSDASAVFFLGLPSHCVNCNNKGL